MFNALIKVVLLILLICLSLSAARADVSPETPFAPSWVIEAKVCPLVNGRASETGCRETRATTVYYGTQCPEEISPDGPMMQRLLRIPPVLFGIASENISVTLTCVSVGSGEDSDL